MSEERLVEIVTAVGLVGSAGTVLLLLGGAVEDLVLVPVTTAFVFALGAAYLLVKRGPS